MIGDVEMKDIQDAINSLISSPNLKKLEGRWWQVYKVGTVIRVDIKGQLQ